MNKTQIKRANKVIKGLEGFANKLEQAYIQNLYAQIREDADLSIDAMEALSMSKAEVEYLANPTTENFVKSIFGEATHD